MAAPAATSGPSSPLPLIPKSRVRVLDRFSFIHSLIYHSLTPVFLLFLAALPSPSSSASADISYADYCGRVVAESSPSFLIANSSGSLRLSRGYFAGGDRFLGQDPDVGFSIPRSFAFYTRSIHKTHTPGTLQVVGVLIFRGGGINVFHRNLTVRGRSLRLFRPWYPRSFTQRGKISFDLSGFWSEETGKLCMVGTGSGRSKEGIPLDLSAVFKVKYPSTANITSSVVSGTVESLDSVDSPSYFDRIMVLAYAQRKYEYTKVSQAQKLCSVIDDFEGESMGFLDGYQSICGSPSNFLRSRFKLYYGSGCSYGNCGPLPNNMRFQPAYLKFSSIECADNGSLHLVVTFSNSSGLSFKMMLEPGMALVAEGSWDRAQNKLCLVACRVQNVTDALSDTAVGDCSIGLSLGFPSVFSIESRSPIIGRIWSKLNESDPGYFDMIQFRSFGYIYNAHTLRYKYTKMDVVRKSCRQYDAPNTGKKRYPDARFSQDMVFNLLVRTSEGKTRSGYAIPLSLGEAVYHYSLDLPALVEKKKSIWNISYTLTLLNVSLYGREAAEISSEGIYNTKTGMVCMVGCHYISTSSIAKQEKIAYSMDCSILINIHVPPLNPEPGEHLNGTIMSTRANRDPLYFAPLEISSRVMYKNQAAQSIWRTDIEITMVLISLTLSCIFTGLQLFHVNKHPEVLPSISITMLVILILGHMIPLMLNFEALLSRNHNKQNVLQGSGGWLEVNKVVVMLMTMVDFLLQCRLLQVSWSARSEYEEIKGLWLAERKAIQFCLPLYIAGGLMDWFVHFRSHKSQQHGSFPIAATYRSPWEDMQSYAGLILDGFLFPQIIFNVICDSKDNSLAPIFYIGTTTMRAVPHVYDAYRTSHYVPHLISSYIYARPNEDLYSLVWDIIIPSGVVMFALVIYVQQRFGGAFIICPRNKSPGVYEMVPVGSS